MALRPLAVMMAVFLSILTGGIFLLVAQRSRAEQQQRDAHAAIASISQNVAILKAQSRSAESEIAKRDAKIAALQAEKAEMARQLAISDRKMAAYREAKAQLPPSPVTNNVQTKPVEPIPVQAEMQRLLEEVAQLRLEKAQLLERITAEAMAAVPAPPPRQERVLGPSEGHARQRSLYPNKSPGKLFGNLR